jgi:hypothetical protein
VSSTYRADGPRMAVTDAVRVPSGGRNQIGRPTAVRHGCGGRGGAKPSREGPPFASASLPLVARLSKSVIEFQD